MKYSTMGGIIGTFVALAVVFYIQTHLDASDAEFFSGRGGVWMFIVASLLAFLWGKAASLDEPFYDEDGVQKPGIDCSLISGVLSGIMSACISWFIVGLILLKFQ